MDFCIGSIAYYNLKKCGLPKMNDKYISRLIVGLVVSVFTLANSTFAFAQGCALCYTQAASGSGRFIHGLRSGILVLVFPPILISVGLARAAYHKRNHFRDGAHGKSKPQE